jgi:predicted  nucleic acid-binding Zn-ribbon protein
MKTILLSLLFLFALPFFAAAQADDKTLNDDLKNVKEEIRQLFKDLENERIFARMDSVLQERWPQIEAELEDAWQKTEPKIEEAGEQIAEIAEEIWREVTGKTGEEMPRPKKEKPRERKEL